MKILITGVAGFIGSNTALFLLERGYRVYGIDNLVGFRRIKELRLKGLIRSRRFEFFEFDLNNRRALTEIVKSRRIDAVLHFASKTSIIPSIKTPLKYIRGNISSSVTLCEVLNKYGVKNVIYSSSSSVYGGAPLPFSESFTDLRPVNPYGITKFSVEKLLYYYHNMYDMNMTVLRYFNVYGPLGRPDISINLFLTSILKGRKIAIYGDGRQRRDFTYIDDVVEANLLALENIRGFQIFNIASGENHSINEIITRIEEVTNTPVAVEHLNLRRGELTNTLGDINKARETLRYHPKVEIGMGLKMTFDWVRKNIDKL